MAKRKRNPRRKLNARQERFAAAVAAGKPQRHAYEQAGYKPSDPHASRLANNGKVNGRVMELVEEASVDDLRTLESVVKAHKATYDAAFKDGQYAAANRAQELIGKTAGLYHDRVFIAEIEKVSHERLLQAISGGDQARAEAAAKLLAAPDGFSGSPDTQSGGEADESPAETGAYDDDDAHG